MNAEPVLSSYAGLSREAGITGELTNFRAAFIMADLKTSALSISHFRALSSPFLRLAAWDL
jgi:hypothetical protein